MISIQFFLWDLHKNTTFLFVLAAISCYYSLAFINKRKYPPLPPGPLGLPLLGFLPFLTPELHSNFAALAQSYGPILSLRLGTKTAIIVTSPSAARAVLKDHDATFANRDVTAAGRAASYGGNDIAWSANSPQWRMLRRVCVQEMLGSAALDALYSHRRREVRQMVRHCFGRVGSPINVGVLLFMTSFNVTSMLWGGTVKDEERERRGAEFRKMVAEMTGLMMKPNLSDFFPGLARFDLQGITKQMEELAEQFDLMGSLMT